MCIYSKFPYHLHMSVTTLFSILRIFSSKNVMLIPWGLLFYQTLFPWSPFINSISLTWLLDIRGTVGGGLKGLGEEWSIKPMLSHNDVRITLVLSVAPACLYLDASASSAWGTLPRFSHSLRLSAHAATSINNTPVAPFPGFHSAFLLPSLQYLFLLVLLYSYG